MDGAAVSCAGAHLTLTYGSHCLIPTADAVAAAAERFREGEAKEGGSISAGDPSSSNCRRLMRATYLLPCEEVGVIKSAKEGEVSGDQGGIYESVYVRAGLSGSYDPICRKAEENETHQGRVVWEQQKHEKKMKEEDRRESDGTASSGRVGASGVAVRRTNEAESGPQQRQPDDDDDAARGVGCFEIRENIDDSDAVTDRKVVDIRKEGKVLQALGGLTLDGLKVEGGTAEESKVTEKKKWHKSRFDELIAMEEAAEREEEEARNGKKLNEGKSKSWGGGFEGLKGGFFASAKGASSSSASASKKVLPQKKVKVREDMNTTKLIENRSGRDGVSNARFVERGGGVDLLVKERVIDDKALPPPPPPTRPQASLSQTTAAAGEGGTTRRVSKFKMNRMKNKY